MICEYNLMSSLDNRDHVFRSMWGWDDDESWGDFKRIADKFPPVLSARSDKNGKILFEIDCNYTDMDNRKSNYLSLNNRKRTDAFEILVEDFYVFMSEDDCTRYYDAEKFYRTWSSIVLSDE